MQRNRFLPFRQAAAMTTKTVLLAQYNAALDMLAQTIDACPDAIWFDDEAPNRFWQVAFHALFYVHLYAQPTVEAFEPWEHYRLDYEMLGPPPWEPDKTLVFDQPYTKDEVLTYLAFCRNELARQIGALDLDAPSGFHWLPFNKLELQIYNIRHLQQHVGELSGRLLTAGITINWVGTQPG